MSLRLPSYMFCLVSSSLPVICNCLQFIQSYKSHSFIHSYNYIHTFILSHINAYTTYKQYQSIQGCISHQNLVSVVSLQCGPCLSSCHALGSNKRTTCNHHFHQKCHPQCVWSRDVTNQSFQVVSPKRGTTRIYVLSCFERAVLNRQLEFYLVSSGQS